MDLIEPTETNTALQQSLKSLARSPIRKLRVQWRSLFLAPMASFAITRLHKVAMTARSDGSILLNVRATSNSYRAGAVPRTAEKSTKSEFYTQDTEVF